MLLATINSGTLIIALPDLERALDTSILGLVWVILAYMIASTVLVLTAGRLSDLFGRKRAYVGGFVRLRARLAGRRLRVRRDDADPLAHPAGDRRRVPVRERGRASSPTRSRASSSASRWGRTRWSRRSASCSGRSSAARSSRSRGTGCSGSTSRSRRSARSGRRSCCASSSSRSARRGFDLLGTDGLRGRAHRARARRLARRDLRLDRSAHGRLADRRGGPAAAVRADRAPRAARRCST